MSEFSRIEVAPSIIDAQDAQLLGEHVLATHQCTMEELENTRTRLPSIRYILGKAEDDRPTYAVRTPLAQRGRMLLDAADFSIVLAGKEAFWDALPIHLRNDKTTVSGEIMLGTTGDGLWHVDPSEEVRCLTNISRHPQELLVATHWSAADFHPVRRNSWDKPYGPEASHQDRLTIQTGDGFMINNLDHDHQQHQPHCGVDTPDKIQLRYYAFT